MKTYLKYYGLILIISVLLSCDKEPDLRMPEVSVAATPYLIPSENTDIVIDLNDPTGFNAEFVINTMFNDPFQKLTVVVVRNGDYANQYVLSDNITSVPSTVTLTADNLVTAIPELNSPSDFAVGDNYNIFINVTLNDGTLIPGYNADGSITTSPSVQNSIANLHDGIVELNVTIPCPFDFNLFLGAYTVDEEGYGVYNLNFSLDPNVPNRIHNSNFWDFAGTGATIYYDLSGDVEQTVTVPEQPFTFGDESIGTVSGSGTYNSCDGTMVVDYTVNYGGVDYDTHHEFSPAGK